jgi:hypothetical protein
LKAADEPTVDAEQMLGTFVSALQHLEDHKRRIVEGRKVEKSETGAYTKCCARDNKVV